MMLRVSTLVTSLFVLDIVERFFQFLNIFGYCCRFVDREASPFCLKCLHCFWLLVYGSVMFLKGGKKVIL